jgi:hypothetical protein
MAMPKRKKSKIKLHDVTKDLTSKHFAELIHLRNAHNEIENRSLSFDRKMKCRYEDRESVLATQMMDIQSKGDNVSVSFRQAHISGSELQLFSLIRNISNVSGRCSRYRRKMPKFV